MKRTVILLSAMALLLGGCGEDSVQNADFFVFGTLVEVSLSGADKHTASLAFTQLQEEFQAMHRDWHPWEPGLLTTINRQFAGGLPAKADEKTVRLLEYAQQAERASGGLFNPAIGKLLAVWGFHTSDFPVTGPPPGQQLISRLVADHPSSLDIEIAGEALFSSNPAVQLDFGGIAKGFAVDLACETLAALGVQNAIVNAGGDLRAFGFHGDRPWRVAIRNPLGGIVGGVEIAGDEAVFTSGNYERFLETDRHERYAHILDPRSGWPAREIISATVITHSGWLADAAATALVIAGLSGWQEVAESMGLDSLLLTDEEGRLYATEKMLTRLELADGLQPVLKLEWR